MHYIPQQYLSQNLIKKHLKSSVKQMASGYFILKSAAKLGKVIWENSFQPSPTLIYRLLL